MAGKRISCWAKNERVPWRGTAPEWYYNISAKLLPGYRAGLGTVPALTIGAGF